MEDPALRTMRHRSVFGGGFARYTRKPSVCSVRAHVRTPLTCNRWLIDHDQDVEGMKVLVDLHGGDSEGSTARAEFDEIKETVIIEVGRLHANCVTCLWAAQRENGAERTYAAMWRRYKRRVLLAMSSQMFAQLVSGAFPLSLP